MATALTLLRGRATERRQSKSSASLIDGTRVVGYSLKCHGSERVVRYTCSHRDILVYGGRGTSLKFTPQTDESTAGLRCGLRQTRGILLRCYATQGLYHGCMQGLYNSRHFRVVRTNAQGCRRLYVRLVGHAPTPLVGAILMSLVRPDVCVLVVIGVTRIDATASRASGTEAATIIPPSW